MTLAAVPTPYKTLVSLIVAAAENDVIGRENAMPWHLPDDLKRFKALTVGKPVLMGRKTFDAIGFPLPGRKNLVVTRDPAWRADGVVAVRSLDEGIERAGRVAEIAVIGGAEIFRLALPLAARIHLTRVHARIAGDREFLSLEASQWREVERIEHPADDRHPFAMTFSTLERIRS
jgi:dihydrofolate reductase